VNHISKLLNAIGWDDTLGDIGQDRDGVVAGVGTLNPTHWSLDIDGLPESDLLSFRFTSGGLCSFRGTAEFWSSFGIEISPYFQELTGLPHFLMWDADNFGYDLSLSPVVAGERYFINGANVEIHENFGTRSLFQTCEERQEIIVYSDIPLPAEDRVENLKHSKRLLLAHFDIKNAVDYRSERHIANYLLSDNWNIIAPAICPFQEFDKPSQLGHVFNVLPSELASLNFRAMIVRRTFNFTTNSYEQTEEPLMTRPADLMRIKLVFSVQQ
jgi:hypothetical protein